MMLFSFNEWWAALNTAEQVFWFLGGAGTILLILQTLLSFIGIDADTDFDTDLSAEISADLSIFSLKSMVAFLTFFGWMGVIALGRGWSMPIVILSAAGSGFLAMALVAYMLYQFQKLETSGTMKLNEAISRQADVYLTIPAAAAGEGKVTLELNGNVRELRAITRGDSIPTGSRVRIVDLMEDSTLLVEPLPQLSQGQTFEKL